MNVGYLFTIFYTLSLSSHFLSRQYLKNGMIVEIQIWHVDVTDPRDMPYFKVTLNSH